MAVGNITQATTETPPVTSRRRRDQIELWVGYVLILIVIWTPRLWQKRTYFVAAIFIVATTFLSFPGRKAMGLRATNLLRSSWLIGVSILLAILAALVARRIHTLHTPGSPMLFLERYTGYIIFAFVQQFLLQDYFLPRFLRLITNPTSAALATAAIFSLAHLPNPILTVITFVWGFASCLIFLRYRNLFPLAIAHAILGITVAVIIPGPVIHNMRVGLGYLTYRAHPIHHRSH
jgi:membrane protease YdiL (CAAX protease family)